MNGRSRRRGTLLLAAGLIMIAGAGLLTLWNVYDQQHAEKTAAEAARQIEMLQEEERSRIQEQMALAEGEAAYPDYVLNPDMDMPVKEAEGREYIGILEIPALEKKLPVICEWNYDNLRAAPCRYQGTAYKNDMILAGHNYASHFGDLKLLHVGDEIRFTDNDGNRFIYEVVLLETLSPHAVEEMKSGGWDLTLFTCTVGGSYRVTVRCRLAEEQAAF